MLRTRLLIVPALAFTVAMTPAVPAATIHVDVNCPGPGDGSIGDPYCSIQTAIDNALDTDEIVVADGTYTGPGNRDLDFGGKLITLRSENGPVNCIIDSEGSAQDQHRGFFFHSGETSAAVLDGFTIRGGRMGSGQECLLAVGGGIRCVDSSPTIINCIITGNRASSFCSGVGAGIHSLGGSPTIINCTFINNRAFGLESGAAGGGIFCGTGSPLIANCTFIGNTALTGEGVASGGALFTSTGNAIVVNCTFSANSSDTGGGMKNLNSSPTVINCAFSENIASSCCGDSGGGMHNSHDSSAVVINSILWNNSPDQLLDAFGAATTVTYSNVQGGWSGAGLNNIDADPLFVLPGNCCIPHDGPGCDDPGCQALVCGACPFCCAVPWAQFCVDLAADLCGDLCFSRRLSPGSPCIDAGDNTAVPADITTDLDGNPRFVDDPDTVDSGMGDPPIVDMGAYEFQGPPCPGDLDGDGNVFVTDLLLLLMDFGSCNGSPADLDGDGCVTVADLLTLLGTWGPCPGSPCVWDVNGDGTVDPTDLRLVLGNLGPCEGCPEDVNGDGVVNGQDAAAVATHFGPCP